MSGHPYAHRPHSHQHPYATASRALQPPPQPSDARRRSTSLPHHSHLGPPSAPPSIPLPEVPSPIVEDWAPRPPLSPRSGPQLLGPGIPPLSQSRSLPATAGAESRFPALLEAHQERTSTDSAASGLSDVHSHAYSSSLSRPNSRASGTLQSVSSMRRYSSTGGWRGDSAGEGKRERALTVEEGYDSLIPPLAMDTSTPSERERQKALDRRGRGKLMSFMGMNTHAYSSSNPSNTTPPPQGGGGWTGPPSPKPVRTSPSLPHFPHALEGDPVTVRRKMSAPRVDTSIMGRESLSLRRRPSLGLGREVGISPVEEGRARSNSKTLSGRDTPTPSSLSKLLPSPFPLPPSPNSGTPDHPFHIAVFGPEGSGKTTFVLGGMEGWPGVRRVGEVEDRDGKLLYQYRTSRIRMSAPDPGPAPEMHYRILEIDSTLIDWEGDERDWPGWMPYVDGAFVLFDATGRRTAWVSSAVDLIRDLNLPCIVVATKTDLPQALPTTTLDQRTRTRDVGLVPSSSDTAHKNRIAPKHCFRYMCKVVTGGEIHGRAQVMTPVLTTPVTPIIMTLPSRPPSPAKPAPAMLAVQSNAQQIDRMGTPTPTTLPVPLTPVVSVPEEEDTTVTIHPEPAPVKQRPRSQSVTTYAPQLRSSYIASLSTNNLLDLDKEVQAAEEREQQLQDEKREEGADAEGVSKLPPTYMYSTLEALCERVFFMAISDSDLTFLYHFFLTYRKFTTARFVLREWQKYWDSLNDQKINENMYLWGKLRLAHLILDWVTNFPQDFSQDVPYRALRATHKVIAEEDNTLFHATQLKLLINKINRSDDPDRAWEVDSDEDSVEENDRLIPRTNSQRKLTPTSTPRGSNYVLSPSYSSDLSSLSTGRSRVAVRKKPSMTPGAFERRQISDDRQLLKDLSKMAGNVERLTPAQIARELTRLELPLFLDIEPREWARHLWTPAKERSYPDPIDCMAVHFMRVQTWVASLILAREGQTARSSLISKFCLVGHELRKLNNFNSLRAVHVGIKDALPNAPDILHSYLNNQQIWNMFHYHDLLFSTDRNHLIYHRTLLHTAFFAIPCFEIHTSTLARSDRNLEWHPDQPKLVHWGKFGIFGKIVDQVTKFQERVPPTLPEDAVTTQNFHQWFVKQSLMSRTLMEKRRAPEHFVDKSMYEAAKGFLRQRARLDQPASESTVTASSYTFLSS
ncbi:ras GEF [Dacryopinax primogenitus]|uniref:Ras GEF n=1 Tax=Dacryopinax primogenitus (strain DJM 731) TaxID=1858805 RepID=M5FVA5_DACPD|nr:ras GEF [Dacryopinax primogenitus]EJU00194.1 ras GEF [Dacryopinax primogenitus]